MGQNRTSVSIDLKGISLTPSEVYLAGIRATIVNIHEGTLTVAAGPSQVPSVGDITIEFDEDEESPTPTPEPIPKLTIINLSWYSKDMYMITGS